MARARALALVSLLVLPLLAGCGGKSVRLHGQTLHVALTEYRITPNTIHMHPGPLTIVARNDGVAVHDVAVGVTPLIIGRTPLIEPGQTGVAHLKLTRGTYQIFSDISDQDVLGMRGFIYVR